MRRISSACGGIVSRRICSKNSERGLAAAVQQVGHVGRAHAAEAGLEVPLAGGLELLEQALGVEARRARAGSRARRGARGRPCASPAVAAWASARSPVEVVGVDDPHQAEVEEADAAVVEQQVVARVRVAGGAAQVCLSVPKKKRKTISAKRSRSASGSCLTASKRRPVEQLGDEHAAVRELGVDRRHVGERVSAPGARHRAVVLGLDLVVELVADPLAQLLRQRLDVEARGEALDQRQQHLQVAQVGLDRLGDARVLDLDRDGAAVERRRAVDLADRGGGERLLARTRRRRRRAACPSSSLSSFSTFLNGSGGTSSRSAASVALNSSRSDSGIAVKSTVESTWPTFIAAPRIWPSCLTSSRAVAAARSPVAASARSSERSVLAARVPAQRRPWPATRPPKRRERAMREVGGESGTY